MTTKLKYLRFYYTSIWDGNYIDFYKQPIATEIDQKSLHYKITTKDYYNDSTEILNKDNIRVVNSIPINVETLYTNHIAPVRSIPYLQQLTPSGDWILTTGFWTDSSIWIDTEFWND